MSTDSAASGISTTVNGISLRPGDEADLPAILAIEQASFPSPWTQASFLRDLHNPYARLLVAEQADQVIGYLCCWVVADESHILKVAVHPNYRQRGIAKELLRKILFDAHQRGARTACLEVRKSNQPAIMLYRQQGFCEITVRHQYYEDGEDALLMLCSLSD